MADAVTTRERGTVSGIRLDSWTAAVTMSHSYTQDLEVITELAQSSSFPPYIGVLGPRKRTEQLLADAGLDGDAIAPFLHSPMGLDIGAEGPDQVALAVVCEIQAVMNGRSGGPLRERRGPIHSWDENQDLSQTRQSVVPSGVCA